MIHTIKGKLISTTKEYVVVDIGSMGFKVLVSPGTIDSLPEIGKEVRLYCYLYVREKDLELYGFLNERSLKLFEMLTSVSGIGPKTAIGVLDISSVDKVIAAIVEKKTDFLTRAPGIGKKTAERAILELHNKLHLPDSEKIGSTMEIDSDVEDALVSLGYSKRDVKNAVSRLGEEPKKLEDRLREALKILS